MAAGSFLPLCWALAAGVVDGIVSGEDELRHGHECIALLQQTLDDTRQSLGGVLGGVVEQHDGAGADLGCDPFGDVGGRKVLPVQTVPTGNSWNRLWHNELRMWK